jgi:4-hydroxybenzoate polyprenyltransferase
MLPRSFVSTLAAYVLGTCVYSLRLKHVPALDVMVLAGLYILRIVAGGAATAIPVSTWLMAFALFVCLSLAFLKRFMEIAALPADASSFVAGRDYRAGDTQWLQAAGLASAYVSAVVLAIYVNHTDVTRLYSHPDRLLLMCPIVVYWTTRWWMYANRGITNDDPVVAIASDPVTYVLSAVSLVIVVAAA